jgi:hypothetical protein
MTSRHDSVMAMEAGISSSDDCVCQLFHMTSIPFTFYTSQEVMTVPKAGISSSGDGDCILLTLLDMFHPYYCQHLEI